MIAIIRYIVIFLSCASTALIYENFMSYNFNRKQKGTYLGYFGVCVIINCIINLIGNTYLNYLWSLIFIIYISYYLYDSDEKENTFIPLLFLCLILVMEETLVCYFLEWYFTHNQIPFDNFYYIAVFCSNILMLVSYKPIRNLLSKKDRFVRNRNLIETILIFSSFVVVMLLPQFMKQNLSSSHLIILITICVVLLCFDIYLIFVLDKINLNNQLAEELKLMKLQTETNEAIFQSKIQQYNQQAKLFHDIKNHLSVIDSLYSDGNGERARDYTNDLLKIMNNESVSVNNNVLRIMIKDFISNCKENNVEFKYKVDSRIGYENIKDTDIVTIYSNVFDNALNAAKKCENPSISLKIFIHQNMVVTILCNNYVGNIRVEHNKIISNKKNHVGYGIRNVIESINKYNGIYDIDYSNNIFKIQIILPLGE